MKKEIVFISIFLIYGTSYAQDVEVPARTTTIITNTNPTAANPTSNTTVTTTTAPVVVVRPEDDRIVTAIYNKFHEVPALTGTALSVKSENGVVTVSGTVTSQSQADAAVEAARTIPGVRDARSSIQVTTNPNLNRPSNITPNY